MCEGYFPAGERDRERRMKKPQTPTQAAPRIMAILDTAVKHRPACGEGETVDLIVD